MLLQSSGLMSTEEHTAHGGIDIEDDEHQQRNIAHARDRGDKGVHQHPQFRDDGDQAQYPEDPQQPPQQGGLAVLEGDQAGHHDDEIEDIPALGEKALQTLLGDHADDDLSQKEQRDGHIEDLEDLADAGGDGVGLGADDHGGNHDHQDHEGLEKLILTQLDEALLQRGGINTHWNLPK